MKRIGIIGSRRAVFVVIAALASALVLAGPANVIAKKKHHHKTKVVVVAFTVGTSAGNLPPATPGATVTHCADENVINLNFEGRVKHAKTNKHFQEIWSLNGAARDTFGGKWTQTGNGPIAHGISTSSNSVSLPDGLWTLTYTQGGKQIGTGSVTIATNPDPVNC